MEAKDLRIGNYIDYETEREIVTMQTTYEYIRLIHNENKNFKPIELTEEWLLKFGFEKHGEYGEYYRVFNKGLILDIEDTNNEFIVWAKIGDDILKPLLKVGYPISYIQHVHQLQNLYFALTNEELTLWNT